jgi:hypothetical protein
MPKYPKDQCSVWFGEKQKSHTVDAWEQIFSELVQFKKQYGHCNVPYNWSENPKLFMWVSRQRSAKKRGQLSDRQVSSLSDIGFVWDQHDATWNEMYSALVKFKEIHSHCNVPAIQPHDRWLANWVDLQRQLLNEGALSEERIIRLDKVGFVWTTRDFKWYRYLEEYIPYKVLPRQLAMQKMPARCLRSASRVFRWATIQSKLRAEGLLDRNKIQSLDDIDSLWDLETPTWEKMFLALGRYKRIHAHHNIPGDWTENPNLIQWVLRQLRTTGKGEPNEQQIMHLGEIGFKWGQYRTEWEIMFFALEWDQMLGELKTFKEMHGHCNVLDNQPLDSKLAMWVRNQRQAKDKGNLSQDRIRRLEEIGFQW